METIAKIGLGGGCHWCTEAIFQSLKGVHLVHQGFVSSTGKQSGWSEAVVVAYLPQEISLEDVIAVHLHTHKSTVAHSMRNKYRSAVYFFDVKDKQIIHHILKKLQADFTEKLIAQVLPFIAFKPSEKQYKDYYYSNPERPFCKTYISPKLKLLLNRFSNLIKTDHKMRLVK